MRTPPMLGIIAEDESDVRVIKTLAERISGLPGIPTKSFNGKGCSKLRRKCGEWVKLLKLRGCRTLIVVHDLDRNGHSELHKLLHSILKDCPIPNWTVCIPIEELEAWLLSDPETIKTIFNLPRQPRLPSNPERIVGPKEELRRIVEKTSGGKRLYLNTKHNEKISELISIDMIGNKCPSFQPFREFVLNQYSAPTKRRR